LGVVTAGGKKGTPTNDEDKQSESNPDTSRAKEGRSASSQAKIKVSSGGREHDAKHKWYAPAIKQ